jgi:hypothetical protein
MRRRVVFDDLPPAMLVRFDREQWPGDNLNASFDLWRVARAAFEEVHGWPGGFVEMLQQNYQERRRVFFPGMPP